jgi:voltage-gated potassium channel
VHRLHEEWRGIGGEIAHIEETLRQKRLEERVVARLGSRGWATALEASVLVFICVVLAMLVWEETLGRTAAPHLLRTLAYIDTAICAFFLWEFFWKMRLSGAPGWYFKRHWIDFVSSLPFALMHAEVLRLGRVARLMRIARAARMARALRLLRAVRAMAFVFRGFEKVGQSLNIRVLNRPLAATLVFLVIGGIVMGSLETDAFDKYGSPVRGGIWWSFVTVCTGGFADIHDPDTDAGRALTVVLVIMGAILTGAFTAALASVLLGDDTERIERKLSTVLERMDSRDQQGK